MTNDLHHLAAAYALDALDDRERHAFEAHYPSCEICAQEVVDFRLVASALADAAAAEPPVDHTADLKAKVMAEVAATRQLSPLVADVSDLDARRRSVGGGRRFLAAAAALFLLAGVAAVALQRPDPTDPADVLAADDATIVSLAATDASSTGNLDIIWSDELDHVAVIGTDLVDVDSDFAYALWFLLDEGVAPAGLFQPVNGFVSEAISVDDLEVTGWGITIEPATGSPQPTTEVIFAGTL